MALRAERGVGAGIMLVLALSQSTCVTSEPESPAMPAPTQVAPPPLVVAPVQDTPQEAPLPAEPAPPASELEKLRALLDGNAPWRAAVADVLAMLEAEELEKRGDFDAAKDAWRKALLTARGGTGKQAFEAWVAAYAKALKRGDEDALARLVMAESDQGQRFPYMLQQGLTEKARVANRVRDVLVRMGLAAEAHRGVTVPVGAAGQAPAGDPTFEKAAQRRCAPSVANQSEADAWAASLPRAVNAYWRGLVARCQGRRGEARKLIAEASDGMAGQRAWASLAVRAYELRLLLEREEGDRAAMADTYLSLIAAFAAPGARAEGYGETPWEFALRRIDATLSAARYRSLVNDYLKAKSLIQEAFRLVKATDAAYPRKTTGQRNKLGELRADAYHTLAFRIAVEQGDVAAALEATRLGLAESDIPADWRERLQWASGLYAYLLGKPADAVRAWQALLANGKNDAMQPQLLFWIARAARQAGDSRVADDNVARLFTQYPLHYYTVVAASEAGLAPADAWTQAFRDMAELKGRLASSQDLAQSLLRKDEEMARLLLRAEILVKVGSARYAKPVTMEFTQALKRKYRLNAQTADAFVYASRLLYQAGEYNESIAMTTNAASAIADFWQRYPEQLIIHFPQPYASLYQEAAAMDYLEPEVLMAITRQESGFRAGVVSPAGAMGLMQLMPATAESVAREKDLATDDIVARLLVPEGNIALGSGYVRRLARHYAGREAEIYAAYNAGEYAVDAWLKTRPRKDLLAWIELSPFMETREYAKNVWRNALVYRFLLRFEGRVSQGPAGRGKAG